MSFSFPSPKEIDESWWGKQILAREYNPNQLEFKYFFPLTEQISLDLDYTDCEKPLLTTSCNLNLNGLTTYTLGTLGATTIAPQLTISPNNPVGSLRIGGINIGLEKKPNLFQRVLHKLLGFDWKDK